MTAASNYLENKVLDHVLKNTAFTQPSSLYLALFNNTSGNAAANLEAGILTDEVSISGTAYTRKTISFDSSVNGTASSSTTVTFDTATASWGTITHVAICDGGTRGAGNVLFWGAVTTAKAIDSGDSFSVAAGNLTISLA